MNADQHWDVFIIDKLRPVQQVLKLQLVFISKHPLNALSMSSH